MQTSPFLVGPSALALLLLASCHAALPPTFVASAKTASRIEVRRGVPRGESAPEGAVRVHGEVLQGRFVDLSDEDRKAIAAIVADEATYASHVEGKKCGGFHADYAVQWKSDGDAYQVLFCFGCHEALSLGDGGERLNDLSDQGYQRLATIFDRATR